MVKYSCLYILSYQCDYNEILHVYKMFLELDQSSIKWNNNNFIEFRIK